MESDKRALLLMFCVVAVTIAHVAAQNSNEEVASSLEMFVDELPDMPAVRGYESENGRYNSGEVHIGMYKKKWKFHRDLPETTVFAYGKERETASVPGPTIEAVQGIETVVTWKNHLPASHILPLDPTLATAAPKHGGIPTVVHLHGGVVEPESDGNSLAWFTAGFNETGPAWKKSTYRYMNVQQPGNLWYHDHAMGLTRVNLLAGLIGAYVIRSPSIETPLRLPSGPQYDRVFVLFDRSFSQDGSLYMNATGNEPSVHPQWQPEYFGDVIIVNGKAWPYMNVQRRKYRFRIVNAANARYFTLTLKNGLSMTQIGSDSTYLLRPVPINELVLGPSEIADIIIDFANSSTNETVLTNSAPYPYPMGAQVNDLNSKVMKFVIEGTEYPSVTEDIPHILVRNPRAKMENIVQTRYITMYMYQSKNGEETGMLFNNLTFEAPVTEKPKQGTTELWNIINLTMHSHTVHIHLGLFVILNQTELVDMMDFQMCMEDMNDALKCNISDYAKGKVIPTPANEGNWKNVVKTPGGYVTTILVRFSALDSHPHDPPYPFDATAEPGYVYHCHILDHEDNAMMRPLKIVQ